MDKYRGTRMQRWMRTPEGHFLTRLIIMLLILQPLWSISQRYHWDPASLRSLLSALVTPVVNLVHIPEARAATPVGTFAAFGPEHYVRGMGDPLPETTTFSLLAPNPACTLRIDNGGLKGQFDAVDGTFEEVASAVVTLNGVDVVRPNEFNKTVRVIEKPVALALANTLTVEVRSQPESGFTLRIVCVDDTPPTITATVDPPANAVGWHNTDVTVRFECSDSTSGIASCSDSVTVTAEGAGQEVVGTAVDLAGNEASVAVTLHIDKTPPQLMAHIDPVPNANGWNNAATTVSFEATDVLSGVEQVTPAVPIGTEGAGQQVTGTATDQAGNTASTTVTVNLDATPPFIAAAVTPAANANGWHKSDPRSPLQPRTHCPALPRLVRT